MYVTYDLRRRRSLWLRRDARYLRFRRRRRAGAFRRLGCRPRLRNRFGAIEGTLVLPAACGPRPVALIIAGSGPTDRNGNQATLTAQPYRLLASALAARGVGSLRYDKAGIAASAHAAPSESDLRFEMGADDAVLLVTKLRADPRVGAVTIIGHSEGSLVGMLAAERVPVDGFVSLAGAGRPIAEILREQLVKAVKDPTLLAKANAIIASLVAGNTVSDVPKELAVLLSPMRSGSRRRGPARRSSSSR